MNALHYYEELDAMNAAADRFDGFDRGDADNDAAELRAIRRAATANAVYVDDDIEF